MSPEDRKWLREVIDDSRSPCNCCDCDGRVCLWCLEHHGKKPCPMVTAVRKEIAEKRLELVRAAKRTLRMVPGITCHPDVQGGQPCIEGTRMPAQAVCSLFYDHGFSTVEIRGPDWYPHLTQDQVEAALRFGMRNPKLWAVPVERRKA